MADPSDALRARLLAFAHHVREPGAHAPPPGIEERRLRVYRELFLSSIGGLLAGNFPVLRRTLADDAWQALVRAFYTGHRCTTPLFTEVAREFVDWLSTRDAAATGDPPWLAELAHYEWVELALQISEADAPDIVGAAHVGAAHAGLALSPLARPLAYTWPVHRIGPAWQPTEVPANPTLLLARRDAGGDVHFSELSPLVFRLLQLLDTGAPPRTAGDALALLAREAGAADDDAFRADGLAMLQRLLDEGTVIGALC